MIYTHEICNEIREMASLLFGPEEIAKVLGIEVNELVDSLAVTDHPAARAYAAGMLQTELELRRSILRLAKQGSSPAQTMSLKILDSLRLKLDKHNL